MKMKQPIINMRPKSFLDRQNDVEDTLDHGGKLAVGHTAGYCKRQLVITSWDRVSLGIVL